MEPNNLWDAAFSFILHPPQQGLLLDVRNVFLYVSLFFFLFIIFLLFKNTWLKRLIIEDWWEFLHMRPYKTRTIEKEWRRIKDRMESGHESEYKLALQKSDKILTKYLKRMEYEGKNVTAILDNLPVSIFTNIVELRAAHRLTEDISADPKHALSLDQAQKALSAYEEFFRAFELL